MAGKPQSGRDGELVAFGQAVRQRRTAADMTVSDLARTSGVSRRMLQGIEQGSRNSGLRHLFDIAAALGVQPSVLIRDAEADLSP